MGLQLKDKTYYLTSDVGIRHYPVLETCEEHTHDFIEFVYVLNGRCDHSIDGKPFSLKRGDMLIINHGQKHSITGGNCEYVDIFLKPQFINQSLINQENAFALLNLADFSDFRKTLKQMKNVVTFTDFERTTVETIIMNLEEEMNEEPVGHDISTHSWFNLLMVQLFRKMLLLTPQFDGISEELLLYLKTHCHQRLEMGKIAEICHYNPAYFCRCFKEFAGVSFTAYLKNVRMERAMQLLASTKLQIHDICDEVGYTDKTRFFRHFREVVGVTPLAYRKSIKARKVTKE